MSTGGGNKARGSQRKRAGKNPLSKTLWVIYQTVSHTCGPQSLAKNTHTHKHTIITLQICHLNLFLAQKHPFLTT